MKKVPVQPGIDAMAKPWWKQIIDKLGLKLNLPILLLMVKYVVREWKDYFLLSTPSGRITNTNDQFEEEQLHLQLASLCMYYYFPYNRRG